MNVRGLYEKRGWWYYQPPTVEGKRPPAVALRTKVEADAIDKVFKLFHARSLGPESKDSASALLNRYLEEMRTTRAHTPKTSHTTKATLSRLFESWGDPPVKAITKERVIAWRAELNERPGLVDKTMSEASINSYLRRLSGFLSWLVRNKHLREHPMEGIRLPRVKKTRRQKFCTVEQREKLLADPAAAENISFLLHFGFFAGLRFEEMLAMDETWIVESQHRHILTVKATEVWKPKDQEARSIEMHPRLVRFVKNYGIRRPYMLEPDKKVWKVAPAYRFNPKKGFKAFVTDRGMPWVTYHTLRHSFATHLAQAGAPMVEIAGLLGDSLRVTEETYIGFAPSTKSVIGSI